MMTKCINLKLEDGMMKIGALYLSKYKTVGERYIVTERRSLIVHTWMPLSAQPYSDVNFAVHNDQTFSLGHIQSMTQSMDGLAERDEREKSVLVAGRP